jgi:hypothetical protein
MIIGSALVAWLAFPMSPEARARQLDSSAEGTAGFLEKARTESLLRNAPVALRIKVEGKKAVLWMDWNLSGRESHPKGNTLELPRGLMVLESGQPQTGGTLAVFNPRGGATFGAGLSGSSHSQRGTVLNLSWPGTQPNDMREISLTDKGEFQVGSTPTVAKNAPYAAAIKRTGEE